MIKENVIRYCLQDEIDLQKWNRCIKEAANGIIYASSTYLDTMAVKWDALILNDYEAVMPLPWNRKYGLYYLYQPYFIPALGVFGLRNNGVTIDDFLVAIPKKFRYWDIKFSESNLLPPVVSHHQLNARAAINYYLNLNQAYSEIHRGYKRLCVRMIRKASGEGVRVYDGKPEEVIDFYKKLYQLKHTGITAASYHNLVIATSALLMQRQARIYLAKLPDGEITAAYLVLVDDKFVYSLIGGSSPRGKDTGSFYLLTDAAIKDHSGTNRVFRFEGSNIPGIAFFNAQFGPAKLEYLHLVYNNLPLPLKLFK